MIPEHRPTRLPVFLAFALSKIYSIGINHRNRQYDKGVGVTRLDRRVISIGNLSTGGTGKTPLVQHVVRTLFEQGHHPAIAMRGYKAEPGQIGDEQREHMDALPGVQIVAQPNRIAGLRALFESDEGGKVDCVVLDDGFQHRKMARDVDIVLIDASRPPYEDALLPLGFLREPVESLLRADVVVISHAEMIEQEALGKLRRWVQQRISEQAGIVVLEHCWERIVEHLPGSELVDVHPVEYLQDRSVAVLTGIGHPEAFCLMAKEAGAQIVLRCDRPDHDGFPEAFVEGFVREAQLAGATAILATGKDWTKLKSFDFGGNSEHGMPVLVASLGLRFRSGEALLKAACTP